MEPTSIVLGILVALIILLVLAVAADRASEGFDYTPTLKSYIRLYGGFEYKDLKYEFAPTMPIIADRPLNAADGPTFYVKRIIPIDLKSYDINLAAYGDDNDKLRKVEIWSVYDGDVTQSTESDFYNAYLDPSYILRANRAKYRLVAKVQPGQHIRGYVSMPVKTIMLVGGL